MQQARLHILWKTVTGSINDSPYDDPQLSQQQQITHSNNNLITTTTKPSHQNQIAHSTRKELTAQTNALTAQTNTLTVPRNRGSIFCLFLDLKKEGITCSW